MSLIDAVVPEFIENRRKELQQQQQQQSGNVHKSESKSLPSRTATTGAIPYNHEKARSPMHQTTNSSPTSDHQNPPGRSNIDSSLQSASNGGIPYGSSSTSESTRSLHTASTNRVNSPANAGSTHYSHHPHQTSSLNKTIQMSNGAENNPNISHTNHSHHMTGRFINSIV